MKRLPWRREMPPTPAVDEARFRDGTAPYPGHWRRFPEPWPPGGAAGPEAAAELAAALDDLPATWRAVVTGTDVHHRDPADVAAEHGLDRRQERAIRNRARAVLRERLARFLGRPGRR